MISYSRILPLLIIVSILSFSVRLSEIVTGVSNLSISAYAESTDKKEDKHKEDIATKNKHEVKGGKDKESHSKDDGATEHDKASKKDVEQVKGSKAKTPKWRDASDSNIDVAGIKLEMFEDLSQRRVQLDQAEKQLQVREALLKAAEQELDRKVKELTVLQKDIKSLLEKQGGQQEGRITSLVKIYEGMKPKDAARIFDTLDLDVLVPVISNMSERKVSPVLAAMNPERARTVTIMLAEQRTLPTL